MEFGSVGVGCIIGAAAAADLGLGCGCLELEIRTGAGVWSGGVPCRLAQSGGLCLVKYPASSCAFEGLVEFYWPR